MSESGDNFNLDQMIANLKAKNIKLKESNVKKDAQISALKDQDIQRYNDMTAACRVIRHMFVDLKQMREKPERADKIIEKQSALVSDFLKNRLDSERYIYNMDDSFESVTDHINKTLKDLL